jgi:mRNA interferase RelE/StbE
MTTARRWTIEFSKDAQRSLDRIRDKRLLARIDVALARLETNPRPHGYVKLSGHHDLWRISVGDWRIVYSI